MKGRHHILSNEWWEMLKQICLRKNEIQNREYEEQTSYRYRYARKSYDKIEKNK